MSDWERLAEGVKLAGIEPGYWDVWGKYHPTEPAVTRAILSSLGLDSPEAVVAATRTEWARLLPPVVVTSVRRPVLKIYWPESLGPVGVQVHLELEQGSEENFSLEPRLGQSGEQLELDGDRITVIQVDLPAGLPLGYHRLVLAARGRSAQTLLVVAPERAYLPEVLESGGRMAGLSVSLYSLRSRRNWGCGDFTDLESFGQWVAEELGGELVGLNPLHAIHNRQPFNTSPYLPNSVFYRNPIYVDVERLEDFKASRPARALLATSEVQSEIARLRAAELVDYEGVHALKMRFLRLCFETFLRRCRRRSECARRFEEFCQREGVPLDRFATYCALDAWMHQQNPEVWVWTQWPEPYQHPDSPEVERFAREHMKEVLFYKYVQWQLDEQLREVQESLRARGMSIGLYHDLALATDRYGCDMWAYREFFVPGCRVGAPPDDFAPQGQDWGFPPPNSMRHRADGYRLLVESIRHSSRHGGALRIDHVMRFFRLYWIPEGAPAWAGTYVREKAEDLLGVLVLESVRNRFLVVGEDLGTVEPEFRRTLERFGVLSYRLLYFERRPDGRFRLPEEYPRQALVSTSTHDLPTLAGFWLGRDIEARKAAGLVSDEQYREQWRARERDKQLLLEALLEAGLLPSWYPRRASEIGELDGELHNAVVGFLARTPSMVLLLSQEDLTKETEQQNLPGSVWQYPNWRRKMRFTVEELRYSGLVYDCARMFRNWLERTGRRAERLPAAADPGGPAR